MEPAKNKGAAYESGFAAKLGEKEKTDHYKGTFDADRWLLVPLLQESYGSFVEATLGFVSLVASHLTACRGGTRRQSLVFA
jgi:hypothetical protein